MNSRFAHNDLYQHSARCNTGALRARAGCTLPSCCGLATSSKYNGLGLVSVLLVVFFVMQGRALFKDWLGLRRSSFRFVLSALGYEPSARPKPCYGWSTIQVRPCQPEPCQLCPGARSQVGSWAVGAAHPHAGMGRFYLTGERRGLVPHPLLRHLRGKVSPARGTCSWWVSFYWCCWP